MKIKTTITLSIVSFSFLKTSTSSFNPFILTNISLNNNYFKYCIFKNASTSIFLSFYSYKYIIILFLVRLIDNFFEVIHILLTSIIVCYILPNMQLNFISFKFIIQISNLLRNKKIIMIIKTKHKIKRLS